MVQSESEQVREEANGVFSGAQQSEVWIPPLQAMTPQLLWGNLKSWSYTQNVKVRPKYEWWSFFLPEIVLKLITSVVLLFGVIENCKSALSEKTDINLSVVTPLPWSHGRRVPQGTVGSTRLGCPLLQYGESELLNSHMAEREPARGPLF